MRVRAGMWSETERTATLGRIESMASPVLSLYLTTGSSPVDRRNLSSRAKSTIDALDVSQSVRDKALTELERHGPFPIGVAIFVQCDSLDAFTVGMPVEMPIEVPGTGRGLASVGEPAIGPLWAATQRVDHHGVLQISNDRWRSFHVSDEDAVELDKDRRVPTEPEADVKENSRQKRMAWGADRSDDHVDRMEATLEADRRRFFDDAARRTQEQMSRRGLQDLLVLGPEDARKRLETVLDSDRSMTVRAWMPAPPESEASPMRIRDLLQPEIERLRRERQTETLDHIAERGLIGPEACVEAWQQGRLRRVLVGFPTGFEVWMALDGSTLAFSRKGAELHRFDGGARRVSLDEALPELADRFDVEVEILQGDPKERLNAEYGGMAGLIRW